MLTVPGQQRPSVGVLAPGWFSVLAPGRLIIRVVAVQVQIKHRVLHRPREGCTTHNNVRLHPSAHDQDTIESQRNNQLCTAWLLWFRYRTRLMCNQPSRAHGIQSSAVTPEPGTPSAELHPMPLPECCSNALVLTLRSTNSLNQLPQPTPASNCISFKILASVCIPI